jgi:sec-independent protein translocase protein TatC
MANEPEEERTANEDEAGGPVKSFLEHLEDFRWTLIKCFSAIFVGLVIGLYAGNWVVALLMRPLQKAQIEFTGTNQIVSLSLGTNRLGNFDLSDPVRRQLNLGTNRLVPMELVPMDVTIGTNQLRILGVEVITNEAAIAASRHMQMDIVVLSPADAFFVGFRVAVYSGIALASPFIFYFIGQFVLPAMKVREKTYLMKGLFFVVPLFICGVCFCYFILLPASLIAAQVYANWFGFKSTFWEAGQYIGFVCKFMLGMGLGFEMPVVILLLVKIGILNYATLAKARPYMVVINLILGAVLTTPEVVTQMLMFVPLQLLYEISVWIAWFWERKERKLAAAREVDAD